MAIITVNRLPNCNVYVNGGQMLGRAEEVDLPDIKTVQAEHKAVGLIGKLELPSGLDKLEASFKWNSFYSDVFTAIANPFTAVSIQVRASLETWAGGSRVSEVPLIVFLTGTFKEFTAGKFKQHENAEFPSKMNVTYIKKIVNGVDIYEIDVLANIWKVNDVDLLATYRTNIGG
jgi:hypothetical protein